MKPEDKALLQTTIEDELVNLCREIETLQAQTAPVAPDRAIGRLTRMDAIQHKKMAEAQLRKAQTRVAQLEKALHGLAQDQFGICTRCGFAIPVKRLLLVPESKVHVRCPRRRE